MRNVSEKAFTLAETCMTMLILGVLATLTFPVLHNSYQKNVLQTSFVETTKTLNAAFFSYSLKRQANGRLGTSGLFAPEQQSAQNLSLVFKGATSTVGCWKKTIPNKFTGSGGTTDLRTTPCFITGAGKIYAIKSFEDNCTTSVSRVVNGMVLPKLSKACGYVYADLNGYSGPNRFGRDIFAFVITDNPQTYIYPVGGEFWQDSTNDFGGISANSCGTDNEGRTCAARIINDGLKIKYY